MKQRRWSGMTARMGTVLSGAFTIMSTSLYLIFEQRQLRISNCTVNLHGQFTNKLLQQLVRCWSWEIVCLLSFLSIALSGLLLYSVYTQMYRGLLLYAIWILIYEGANLIIQILTNHLSPTELRVLRWFGWGARTLGHCCWLYFVIAYAQVVYKSQNQGNILSYNRRISLGSGATPRRKSKILSFIQHYKSDLKYQRSMNVRMVSFLVGIFSVLNTIQFLIFDMNQTMHIGFEDKFSLYSATGPALASWVLSSWQVVSCTLSITTILISCFLLYCIHKNVYIGLPVYTMWIITYELLSFSIVILLYRTIKDQFRELSHLYLILQVSRMLLHFSGLPFIVKHGYSLYRNPQVLGKMGRRRRSSVSTVDSWPSGLGMLYRKLN